MHDRETSLTSNLSHFHKEGGKKMHDRETSLTSNLSHFHKEGGKKCMTERLA